MIPIIANRYVILGVVIFSLMAYGWFEHNHFIRTKAEFGEFVAAQSALSAQAERDRIKKEVEYREALKTAEFARDAALRRLRDDQASARSRAMSVTPIGTEGRVCFDRAKFDAVLQSFLGEIETGLARGDCSIIESKTCYDAWPK